MGEKNLKMLLKHMQADLCTKQYIFLHSKMLKNEYSKTVFNEKAMCFFKEKEAVTWIIDESLVQSLNEFFIDGFDVEKQLFWSKITLNIHSDLDAVGFLAKITQALAFEHISVNAVSAFFHDHLFVKHENANQALNVLQKLAAD